MKTVKAILITELIYVLTTTFIAIYLIIDTCNKVAADYYAEGLAPIFEVSIFVLPVTFSYIFIFISLLIMKRKKIFSNSRLLTLRQFSALLLTIFPFLLLLDVTFTDSNYIGILFLYFLIYGFLPGLVLTNFVYTIRLIVLIFKQA
jgi:hypothetical protein